MKHKLNYNSENANYLLKEFKENFDFNIKSNSRTPKDAYTRCLFYKILKEFNGMNDRMISDFFKEKGSSKNRASIFHSLSKINVYYASYNEFRNMFKIYFNDQEEKKQIKPKKKAFKQTIKEIDTRQSEIGLDALDTLIGTLPYGSTQRADVTELVKLRVKSWEWKAKNEYEVIECSGQLEGTW